MSDDNNFSLKEIQTKEIEIIYDEAIGKLKLLAKEKEALVNEYIKKLEDQKIEAIKASLKYGN